MTYWLSDERVMCSVSSIMLLSFLLPLLVLLKYHSIKLAIRISAGEMQTSQFKLQISFPFSFVITHRWMFHDYFFIQPYVTDVPSRAVSALGWIILSRPMSICVCVCV